jgi:hypothetical protein
MLPRATDPPVVVTAFIQRAITILVCIAISLIVAYWIGTSQIGYLKIAAGLTIVMFVAGGLRQRAWVLIPMAWAFSGASFFLPFNLSLHDAAILLVFSAYIGYRVLAQQEVRHPIHVLDCLLALLVINTIVDYAHHPAGLQVLGTEMIGGRAYFNIVLALLAYWVILRLPDSVKTVSRIPYFILAGTAVIAMLNIIVYIAPSTTPYLYSLYGGLDYSGFTRSALVDTEISRFTGLRDCGCTLVLVLCALYPPKTLFNPLRPRFYLLALGFTMVLLSGFRGGLLASMMALAISSLLRQGWRGFVMTFLAAGLVLGTVILGQGRLYELPTSVQRGFSFLPGNWSPIVAADAESSSQTRFEWWRQIIQEDVIKNWWFGDGFGMSEKDSENINGKTTFFEWFTLNGSFHNGPLTTIRFAGVIGLVLFYTFIIAAGIYAAKCVRLCQGTSLEPTAIFLAIQLIWFPVEFTFVFGSYDVQLPTEIFLVALLMLLMRMSARARATTAAPRAAQPMTPMPTVAPALR